MRAKFKVDSVTRYKEQATVEMSPVTGDSEENKRFFKYTPTGKITIGTVKLQAAAELEPGAEYYIDFTRAG